MLLKNNSNKKTKQWINKEIRKYIETNENENTIFQDLRDAAKAALRGKSRAI